SGGRLGGGQLICTFSPSPALPPLGGGAPPSFLLPRPSRNHPGRLVKMEATPRAAYRRAAAALSTVQTCSSKPASLSAVARDRSRRLPARQARPLALQPRRVARISSRD